MIPRVQKGQALCFCSPCARSALRISSRLLPLGGKGGWMGWLGGMILGHSEANVFIQLPLFLVSAVNRDGAPD